MATTKEIGEEAENISVQYLISKGFEIKERNWQYLHQELDIIAQKGSLLVVVEVKGRAGNYIVEPQLAVNRNKQRLLISATNAYLQKQKLDLEVRFDIVSVVFYKSGHKLEHIENAFYPIIR